MMWWNGSSWGWGLAILGMLMCVGMMAMMMSHGSRHTDQPINTNVDASGREDTPESILAKRLARGEIDVEEYQRLRDALQRTEGPAPPDAASADRADPHSSTA